MLTVNAVVLKKSPKLPGLDAIAFSPARKTSLFLKNKTLSMDLFTNVGSGFVLSSPMALSAYVNLATVNVVAAVR